jgi:hypothetical protein
MPSESSSRKRGWPLSRTSRGRHRRRTTTIATAFALVVTSVGGFVALSSQADSASARVRIHYGWQLNTSNTGLAGAGIDRTRLRTYNGPIRSGMTLRKVRIPHKVDLSRKRNVTLDRVWINPSRGGRDILVLGNGSVVKWSDIDGWDIPAHEISGNAALRVFNANDYLIRRCKITGAGIGAWIDGNGRGRMVATYLYRSQSSRGAHNDGFTRREGHGRLTISRSRLHVNNPGTTTGPFFLQDTWGRRVGGVLLRRTLVEGIGGVLTLDNRGSGVSFSAENVRLRLLVPNYYAHVIEYGNIRTGTWSNVRVYAPSNGLSAEGRRIRRP